MADLTLAPATPSAASVVLGATSAFTAADDTDSEVAAKFVQFPVSHFTGGLAPVRNIPPDQASNSAVSAAGDVSVSAGGTVTLAGMTDALDAWNLIEVDALVGTGSANTDRWESYLVPAARIGAASAPVNIQVSGVAAARVSLWRSGTNDANITVSASGTAATVRFWRLSAAAGQNVPDTSAALREWTGSTTFASAQLAVRAYRLWVSLIDDNAGNDPLTSPGAWDLIGPTPVASWAVDDDPDKPAPAAKLGIVPGSIERPSGHELPAVEQVDYDAAATTLPAAVLTPLTFSPWPEHVHLEIKASVSSSGIAPDLVLDLRAADGTAVSSRATVETDGQYRYHRLQIIDPDTDAGPVSVTLESVVTDIGVQGGSGTYSLDFRDVLGFRGTSTAARLIASVAEQIIAPPIEEPDMGITQAEAIALINQLVPAAQRIPPLAGHGGALVRAAADASAVHLVQPETIAATVTAAWAQPGQDPPAGLQDVRIVQHGSRTAFARPTQPWRWSIENRLTGDNQFDRTRIELAVLETGGALPSQTDVTAWWEQVFGGGTARIRLATDTDGAGVDAVAERPLQLPDGSSNYWNIVIALSAAVAIPNDVQLNLTSAQLPVEFSHLAADTDIEADTLDFTALAVSQVGRVARIALPGSGALLPDFPGAGQRDGKIVAFVGDDEDWHGPGDFSAAGAVSDSDVILLGQAGRLRRLTVAELKTALGV